MRHFDVFNAAKGAADPALEDTKIQFHTNVKGNIAALSAPLEPRVEDIVFKKRPDARLSDPKFLARFLSVYELAGQSPARARHLICNTEPDLPSAVADGRHRRTLEGRSTASS